MRKIICTILLCLYVSTAAFAAVGQNQKKWAQSALVDAVTAYDSGAYDKAAKILEKILEICPEDDAAHEYMGLCKFALKDTEYAEMHLQKAIELSPDNFWHRYRMSQFYCMCGRMDDAEKIYLSLLEDFPKKDNLYFDLVDIYARQQRFDEALEVLEKIETIFGKNESTARMRAAMLNSMGDQRGAMESLEEFNEEYSSPWVLSILGDYQMSMYNDSTALALYDEALDLEDNYPPALLGKAEAYRITKKFDEYFPLMNSIIRNKEIPADQKCEYLHALGQSVDPRSFKGRESELDSLFSLTTQIHPESYPAAALYIQKLAASGNWEELATKAMSSYERFPGNTVFLEYANLGYYNVQDYKKVLEVSEMVLNEAKDTATIVSAYSTIGDMYHQLGQPSEAYKAYDKALKLKPDYAPVLNNYAYYLSTEKKKLKKAAKMSKITIEAEPDNPTYLDTYGWILFLQGKAAEAKPYFKHAMLYGGKDSAVELDHYAEVLYALGEYDLAFVYWNQAKGKADKGEVAGLEEKIAARKAAIKKK